MQNQSIALDLKESRKRAGLTQVDLAHLLSAKISKVMDIESGRGRPNIDQVIALSLVYGKPIEALVSARLDAAAYRLVARLQKMPAAPKRWREGPKRAATLSTLARRLEAYNDHRHEGV